MVTDVAAGLVLLQIEQKRHPRRLRLDPLTYAVTPIQPPSTPIRGEDPLGPLRGEEGSYTNIIDVESPAAPSPPLPDLSTMSTVNGMRVEGAQGDVYPTPRDWMNIPLAAHYMKFAMASYGWPLFMFTHLFCGMCKLCQTCRYAFCYF